MVNEHLFWGKHEHFIYFVMISLKKSVLIIIITFSGLTLEPNIPKTEINEKSYHLSQASLDLASLHHNDAFGLVQLWVEVSGEKRLMATLSRTIPQVQLNYAFGIGEEVKFISKGNQGFVYLTGFYVPTEVCIPEEIMKVRHFNNQLDKMRLCMFRCFLGFFFQ